MTPDLRATIHSVRSDGRQRNTRCPAHDDRRASLSVGCDNGQVLLHCHAGCSNDAVLEAAGLAWVDLQEHRNERPRIVATYNYTDEDGELLYQVCRLEPKDFRQRRLDATGNFIWNVHGVRRVLFGLPELRGHEVVYIAEGEKDVLALRKLGLTATTNAGGAGKWHDEYTEQLRAAGVKCVVILPDNDDPGRAHADAVARSCQTSELRVKVVPLPDLPVKGDVSDWLAAGHTRSELIAFEESRRKYEPDAATTHVGIELTALGDLLSEPDEVVEYLVEDRIAAGSLNLLAGKPKAGKSTAARALALEIAQGGTWLGFRCEPRPVWYVVLEDKRSEVRRHFRCMGATGREPVRFLFPQATQDLLKQLHAFATQERPGLIIVDTLQRFIGARDLNDYAEVTTKLTPVLALARETGAAVLLVHHAGKGERTGIDAPLGSTALAGSVDNVFLLTRTDRYRVLSSMQRLGPDLAETVLTLDETTGRVNAGPKRHDADRANVETAILAVLDGATAALTEADLEPAVEGKTSLKREALRALVANGRLIREGKGGKSHPFLYRRPRTLPARGDERARDSCSLVPALSREHENRNRFLVENVSNYGTDSCSHDHGPTDHESPPSEHGTERRVKVRL